MAPVRPATRVFLVVSTLLLLLLGVCAQLPELPGSSGLRAAVAGAVCDKLQDVALPGMDATQFCSSSGLGSQVNTIDRCALILAVEKNADGLLPDHDARGPACNLTDPEHQATPASTSMDGQALPQPLEDRRPLPPTLDEALLQAEGATMAWWLAQLQNFGRAAACAATPRAQPGVTPGGVPGWLVPNGWSANSTLWTADTLSARRDTWRPFAAVLTRGDTMAVLLRGTQTFTELLGDLQYTLVAAPPVAPEPLSWPGSTHQGFATLAGAAWPAVRAALEAHVLRPAEAGRATAIKHVTVTGYSLGAGVATLLSHTMQTHLAARGAPHVRVDALLFAGPNVGDAGFTQAYAAAVNGRRLAHEADVVPQLPCSPFMVACTKAVVPTPNPAGHWRYADVPGTLVLRAMHMPTASEAWARFSAGALYPCQLRRFLAATHTCAYSCALSSFLPGGAAHSGCRLLAAGGSADGLHSFCPGFPSDAGDTPFPYQT